jgi:hypothetical protein
MSHCMFGSIWSLSSVRFLAFCFGETAMLSYFGFVLLLQSHVYAGVFLCDVPSFLLYLCVTVTVLHVRRHTSDN